MNYRTKSLIGAVIGVAMSTAAFATDYGVNLHLGGGNATDNQTIANIMAQRGLKQARLDYHDTSEVANLRDQVTRINANGGKVQLIVENNWDPSGSCPQNFSQVETDSYNKTYTMVNAMKDIVHDYEILNEIQNRPEIMAQVTKNSQGTSTSGYYASPCSMTVAYVSRGISRAIHDLGQRAILGVVGRDFGFLTFMQQMGVTWDVTGAHFYQAATNASLDNDSWWGTNGPLYQLHSFGKPITVNEFNCGEIYNSTVDWESCWKAVNKQLTELKNDPYGTIESVHFYELLDEPGKSGAEGIFGIQSTLTSPKISMYEAAAWACGQLTATEKQQLTSRGLVDGSQCTTTSTSTGTSSGSTAPAPTPAPAPAPAPSPTPTTTADTTPPTVKITSPAAGQYLARGSKVVVTVSASDNVGVTWVGIYLNGNVICNGNIRSCTVTLPTWRGAQVLEARAADKALNFAPHYDMTVYTK